MTRHPIGTFVEFTMPRPVASSKNRKRIFGRDRSKNRNSRDKRKFVVLLSEEAERDVADVRLLALAAARGLEFHADDALALTYSHDVHTDAVRIRVEKVGELPPRGGRVKRGTRRDVHGMLETIADALQGVLFPNDSAIDAFGGRRVR